MSLQKGKKNRQAKHQDWKESSQKNVVSKFLAKAKEGERVQKDGDRLEPRISGFLSLYYIDSKVC